MRYEEINGVNWSRLRHMAVSPLQCQHAVLGGVPDSTAFRIGRAVHQLVLEPEKMLVVYSGAARRGKAWEDFREEHEGQEILLQSEAEAARGCADAVLAHPVAAPYLQGGLREHVLQWVDESTGIPCKARVDLLSTRLVELKTARDVGPRLFGAAAARLVYHGQVAFYHDGAQAAGCTLFGLPIVIAAQSSPPYDVAVYSVPDDVLEAGRALYRRLLDQLAECVRTNTWPGICTEEMELQLPTWAFGHGEEITIGGESAF